MKILKIIIFLFVIYLIRRLFQAYKVMKEIQEANSRAQAHAQAQTQEHGKTQNSKNQEVVEADFKVID